MVEGASSAVGRATAWLEASPWWVTVREMLRIGRGRAVALVALTAVQGLVPAAQVVATGELVGRIPAVVGAGVDAAPTRRALVALAVLAGLSLAGYVVSSLTEVLASDVTRRASRTHDLELMAAVAAPATIAHLEDPAFLDRLEAAAGRTRTLPAQAIAFWPSVTTTVLSACAAVLVVARAAPLAALVLTVHALATRGHNRRRYRGITSAVFDQGNLHRRSSYLRTLATTPGPAKEVRVFGLGPWLAHAQEQEWRTAMAPTWGRIWKGTARSSLDLLVYGALLAATAWWLLDRTVAGDIALATAVAALQSSLTIRGLSQASDAEYHFAETALRLPVHRAVVDELHELADADGLDARVLPPGAPTQRITFEDLHFTYPGTDRPVYAGLDLTVDAGTSVALVGVNGAGKTTLVTLLAGLHRPTCGRILIDGTPLDELDPVRWQRRVAAIFQDFWRYPLPVRDNVGLGAPEQLAAGVPVEEALARAGAADLVAGLPQGVDTVLDRQWDGGRELSGGQWQRIALARAMYAVGGGATVLVLDEPTAALDVRAEADVYDRFLDITRGLTSIVISHRFSTVRRADRIVVVDGGRVVEDGTHDELVARGGRYATMFELQARRFHDGDDLEDEIGAPA